MGGPYLNRNHLLHYREGIINAVTPSGNCASFIISIIGIETLEYVLVFKMNSADMTSTGSDYGRVPTHESHGTPVLACP